MEIHPEDSRLTTFPLHRPNIFKWYEDALSCYWVPTDINFSKDVEHYETKLTPNMQRFVKHVLAFFAASDGIVNINLAKRFREDLPILEVGYFYDFQIMMENIHAHTYSLQLDAIIPDSTERNNLLNAVTTMPIIKKMAEFMFKCIKSTAKFAERLLRMACVEGILFTGCFCAIYWLANRGLMPGLSHANELISRDEALHTIFALFIYWMLLDKLSHDDVYAIISEAVELASEFIREALPNGLPEMNAGLMIDYIKSQADNLLTLIDVPKLYNTKHNFHFMEQINQTNRTNFFERRVSEYSRTKVSETKDYEIAEDC
jgi:ribonucleotide reductase beta subunit family protein with ferritin-like domain